MPDSKELSKIVGRGFDKARREFTGRIEPLGFARTKSSFWTRPCGHELALDFIHIYRHGSSHGSPISGVVDIRVHFGIRVLNDSFPAEALKGPQSDPGTLRAGRYHLSFNAESDHSFERCLSDLVRLVQEVGEPWFGKFADPEALLTDSESPLAETVRKSLREAIASQADPDRIAATRELFGLK